MAEAPEPESSLSDLHSPSPLLPHSLVVFHGYSLRLLIPSWCCSLHGLCSVTLGFEGAHESVFPTSSSAIAGLG